jgi:hypothetical protein
MMKKLMKRYERVELQYNVSEARNDLVSEFDNKRLVKNNMKIQIEEENAQGPFFPSNYCRPEL